MSATIYDIKKNDLHYADFEAKLVYLFEKCGFRYHPNNPTMIFKNDLVIFEKMVYNYDKEQLDCLKWLADKQFVFDPFNIGGYFNEFISYTHDNIQQASLTELRESYKHAKEKFFDETTIN